MLKILIRSLIANEKRNTITMATYLFEDKLILLCCICWVFYFFFSIFYSAYSLSKCLIFHSDFQNSIDLMIKFVLHRDNFLIGGETNNKQKVRKQIWQNKIISLVESKLNGRRRIWKYLLRRRVQEPHIYHENVVIWVWR